MAPRRLRERKVLRRVIRTNVEVAPADDELLGRVRIKRAAIMLPLSADEAEDLTWRWPTVVPQTSPFSSIASTGRQNQNWPAAHRTKVETRE